MSLDGIAECCLYRSCLPRFVTLFKLNSLQHTKNAIKYYSCSWTTALVRERFSSKTRCSCLPHIPIYKTTYIPVAWRRNDYMSSTRKLLSFSWLI